jgi:glycine oxidase
MLAPGGEVCSRSAWADFALESLRLYPEFITELEQESGRAIDYRRCGAVEIACTEPDWADLRRRAAAQRELGISAIECGTGDLRRRVPLLGKPAHGALFYPEDAVVDPRNLMAALRAALERRGARILEQCAATAILAGPGPVEIRTSCGRFQAGAAVLAAGAWSGGIPVSLAGIAQEPPATFPVRGHLVGYPLEPGSLGPILRHRHTYLLQRSTGFTIAGTSVEQVGFDRQTDPTIAAGIHARACELLPRLLGSRSFESWVGFRPATADFSPRVTRFQDSRVWLAYGHYRNGILLAPATAARLSREISASSGTGSRTPGGSAR